MLPITTDEITYHILKQFQERTLKIITADLLMTYKPWQKNLLVVKKTDENSWSIANAKLWKKSLWLMTLWYWKGVTLVAKMCFHAGSNILAGENIMLNTHCFVGYFTKFYDGTLQCDNLTSRNIMGHQWLIKMQVLLQTLLLHRVMLN
jgi:hypothetical protein